MVGMHAQSKTIWLFEIFICIFILYDTQVCKGETSKKTTIQLKTSRQINDIRDTGPDTKNTDHGPDMGFYGPLANESE